MIYHQARTNVRITACLRSLTDGVFSREFTTYWLWEILLLCKYLQTVNGGTEGSSGSSAGCNRVGVKHKAGADHSVSSTAGSIANG